MSNEDIDPQIRRLHLLKEEIKISKPLEPEENSFQEAVIKSYTEKLEFLNKAKEIPDIEILKKSKSVKGYAATNDKVPLKLTRDDVFDTVLANHTVDEQILQSREVIELLEKEEDQLDESLKSQEKLNNDLQFLLESLKDGIDENTMRNKEPSYEEQIHVEKIRYRTLRKMLAHLVQKYEE